MARKIIPVGYEDFKEIINKNLYFVDKTLLIRELLDSGGQITLLTRPRRFGKTLNLSILRRFFEDVRTPQGAKIDNSYLFDGLAISHCGHEVLQHQGQYPVINLSLKSAKQINYEMAYACLIDEIIKEFQRHAYVLEKQLPQRTRDVFERILLGKAAPAEYVKSLAFLSECLAKYHGKNVFILIDEYDVPLESAWFAGFYDEMLAFIRSLLESALKTNPHLERGVITGCLRISRENIFTGLNNLSIHSVLSHHFSSRFGFTEQEVIEILTYYDLSEKYPEVQQWYDGYLFGETEIYNPWSIVNYVYHAGGGDSLPAPYWSNTSSNNIVRDLVEKADQQTRQELERLMDDGTIDKPIHEDITYGDIYETKDNLWNFLFFTGYLKAEEKWQQGRELHLRMSIPNEEIAYIYEEFIRSWFERKVEKLDRSTLIKALEEGDCRKAEEFLSHQLMDTISYFDYAEQYYHGFLTGLLKGAGNYEVLSNRESGTGRPDILLKTPFIRNGKVIILELKAAKSYQKMESCCRQYSKSRHRNMKRQPEQKAMKKSSNMVSAFSAKNVL